jgi:hypothetical protein
MSDKIALVDLDGTLADYDGAMERDLRAISSEPLPDDYHESSVGGIWRARVELVRARPGWWESLEPIPAGLELLKYCADIGFDIHILTQAPKENYRAWGEKVAWCARHVAPVFPDYTVSVTRGGKGLHYGRVLIDDWPGFMNEWLENRPRGLGIMPTNQHNRDFSHVQVVHYIPEVGKWKTPELEERLRLAFEREAGGSH